MTKLYLLKPEVSGGFGEKTIITNFEDLKSGKSRIPNVIKLEYVFDDWVGDDLLPQPRVLLRLKNLLNK